MYRPPSHPELKAGLMWRSAIDLNFAGDGDFDIAQPFRMQLPPDGDISTNIDLPQSLWGGVAYSPIDALEIEGNVVWIDWSSFKELRVELPAGAETVSPQLYHDTVSFRAGVEYSFIPQNAAIRAGFVYDPTPIPNETQTATLPDVNRKVVTLGGSLYFGGGNYAAHLGLLWVTPGERDTSDVTYMPVFKGTYGVQAFVTSLAVSGSLGK
jgi:long-chain fatty acid transport protein